MEPPLKRFLSGAHPESEGHLSLLAVTCRQSPPLRVAKYAPCHGEEGCHARCGVAWSSCAPHVCVRIEADLGRTGRVRVAYRAHATMTDSSPLRTMPVVQRTAFVTMVAECATASSAQLSCMRRRGSPRIVTGPPGGRPEVPPPSLLGRFGASPQRASAKGRRPRASPRLASLDACRFRERLVSGVARYVDDLVAQSGLGPLGGAHLEQGRGPIRARRHNGGVQLGPRQTCGGSWLVSRVARSFRDLGVDQQVGRRRAGGLESRLVRRRWPRRLQE